MKSVQWTLGIIVLLLVPSVLSATSINSSKVGEMTKLQSELIKAGSSKSQPVFVIKHDPQEPSLVGEWVRNDGHRVKFGMNDEGQYTAKITYLGPMGKFGFSMDEHTYTFYPSAEPTVYTGKVKWRLKGVEEWEQVYLKLTGPDQFKSYHLNKGFEGNWLRYTPKSAPSKAEEVPSTKETKAPNKTGVNDSKKVSDQKESSTKKKETTQQP